MKHICAWCLQDLCPAEGGDHPDALISHGICPSCADKLRPRHVTSLREIIDSIPIPVLVVDDDVVVRVVNAKACEVLGKDVSAMQGLRGGNVFECVHARRPEGCGRTIHCSGCAIRRAVTRTFETGEPQCMVPATLHHNDPDDPTAVALRITTVNVDGSVFLRVDRMG